MNIELHLTRQQLNEWNGVLFFLLIQIGVFFSICEQAKFNFDGISNVQMA